MSIRGIYPLKGLVGEGPATNIALENLSHSKEKLNRGQSCNMTPDLQTLFLHLTTVTCSLLALSCPFLH